MFTKIVKQVHVDGPLTCPISWGGQLYGPDTLHKLSRLLALQYYRYRLHVQSPSCCQPDGPDPEQLVPVTSSRGCQLDGPVPEQLVEPIQVESPVNLPVRLLVICRLLSAQYPCRQDLTIASYD